VLELSTLGCSSTHNHTLHVLQRTSLGPVPPKAGPGPLVLVWCCPIVTGCELRVPRTFQASGTQQCRSTTGHDSWRKCLAIHTKKSNNTLMFTYLLNMM